MKSLSWAKMGALALAVTFAGGAAPGWKTKSNWYSVVALVDGGHRIGNPDAKVKLTEWVSYTCPHCATFAKEADGALQLVFVGSGKMTRDIRHIVRDPVDLTAAMLANCGAVNKFPLNHNAFMYSQPKWIGLMSSATPAQVARWTSGGQAASRRAIANDFGFYKIMERRGYSRIEADRCLNDSALATRLAENTVKDSQEYKVTGTPSFAINGVLLAGTHSWSALEPQLQARFRPE